MRGGRVAFLGAAAAAGGYTECARVYMNADQTITNALITTLFFSSERFDTDNIFDAAISDNCLTCKTAGKYQITGQVRWALNTTGRRFMGIKLNGTTEIADFEMTKDADGRCNAQLTTLWNMAVNDYVTLTVYQTSGGDLAVTYSTSYSPEFMMARVG